MVREQQMALNSENRIVGVLIAATSRLAGVSESPRLDAELLLARSIDVARSYLFAHPEDELDPAAADRFRQAVEMRANGMPLAYITGEKEFWSMPVIVSPDTLIPRPDTEALVELALSHIPNTVAYRVLDLGTGSGAVALAIARERTLCDVLATDVSAAALRIATENARQLEVPNIEFLESDWFAAIGMATFNIIVSNPPYVAASDEHLDALRHEPVKALVAGPDGLDAIRIIAEQSGSFLEPGGYLLIEHGDRQAESVEELLQSAGWQDVRNFPDIAGRPRVTIATR